MALAAAGNFFNSAYGRSRTVPFSRGEGIVVVVVLVRAAQQSFHATLGQHKIKINRNEHETAPTPPPFKTILDLRVWSFQRWL